jgi:hypothetical protein
MGSNFKLLTYNNSDNLHIKLTGDFDANAAEILVNSLHKYQKQFKKIFIYTSCLNSIESAGAETFQHRYELLADEINDIVFTGEHAEHIAPYAWQVL